MNVVHVQLNLNHPHPEGNKDLEVSLVFNGQPNAEQVFEAFQEVPSVFHHEDFELYRRRLFECLETYGVPQLGKFDMITPQGAPIEVPMVYAAWCLNLVSPTASAMGVQIGSIRIGWRTVHNVVQPAAPEAKTGRGEEQEPKATKATTAIRKARLDPARKTPKNRKVKKEQQ